MGYGAISQLLGSLRRRMPITNRNIHNAEFMAPNEFKSAHFIVVGKLEIFLENATIISIIINSSPNAYLQL